MKKSISAIASCIIIIIAAAAYFIQNGSVKSDFNLDGSMAVHFIDIGQGDSELIQLPNGKNILIDSGEYSEYKKLKSYLTENKVSKIDYCIATHPHSDHMGSMASVIRDFDVINFYMPEIVNDTTSYDKMLDALDDKNIEPQDVKFGDILINDGDIKAEFLAPAETEYKDLNNYSAVLKLTYGDISFLFAGDAESESENDMISSNTDLSADVLKVGHHGSHTSSTSKFLNAIKPEYAVISCGKDNSYNHPSTATVKRLKKQNINILRTDQNGDIIFITYGNTIQYQTSK